jgi:cobyrinic acid a,c-diamide synthase
MLLALKSHVCCGRRIYAECGGLAYLCREIELPDGRRWPMIGALPMTARFHEMAAEPQPAEVTLSADTWLGASSARWRGYLNLDWTLAPAGSGQGCIADAGHETDIVHRHQAVGSRVVVDFAAQEQLLDRFFQPHCTRSLVATANPPSRAWL